MSHLKSVVVLLLHQDVLEAVPHLAGLQLDGLGQGRTNGRRGLYI